jgi:hypothetical protein
MSILHNKHFSHTATNVSLSDDELTVLLDDGRKLSVPLYYFPKLENASKDVRNNYELICRGTGIHWEEIDEDISVAGLLGLPD